MVNATLGSGDRRVGHSGLLGQLSLVHPLKQPVAADVVADVPGWLWR